MKRIIQNSDRFQKHSSEIVRFGWEGKKERKKWHINEVENCQLYDCETEDQRFIELISLSQQMKVNKNRISIGRTSEVIEN